MPPKTRGGVCTRLGASISRHLSSNPIRNSRVRMKVKQTLGTLTTSLATKVEQLSQGQASQVAPVSAQPGTRAGGNPLDTSSQVALMSAQPGTRAGHDSTATSSTSIEGISLPMMYHTMLHTLYSTRDSQFNNIPILVTMVTHIFLPKWFLWQPKSCSVSTMSLLTIVLNMVTIGLELAKLQS